MRYKSIVFLLPFLGLISCSSSHSDISSGQTAKEQLAPTWQPPVTGTSIASIKEKIKEDKLNNRYFTVQVFSTDSSRKGFYKILLSFGYGQETTVVQFPSWTNGIYVKPVLLKGEDAYHARLGFETSDTTFHSYYDIKVVEGAIKMDKVSQYIMSSQ